MRNIVYIVISAAIVIFISLSFCNVNFASEIDDNERAGVSAIKELQAKNTDDIEEKIEKIQEKYKPVEINSDNSQLDYKSIFKDDVFVGDSQTEGFTVYGYLNETSVLAEKGKSVSTAKDYLESLKYLSPKNVYLLFGMNDMLIYNDVNNFVDAYIELIESIQKELPDTNIYVQSVMVARDDVIASQPLFSKERNTEANELLEDYCEKNEIGFIDIKSILENDNTLYEADGLHVKASFYKLWLAKVYSSK